MVDSFSRNLADQARPYFPHASRVSCSERLCDNPEFANRVPTSTPRAWGAHAARPHFLLPSMPFLGLAPHRPDFSHGPASCYASIGWRPGLSGTTSSITFSTYSPQPRAAFLLGQVSCPSVPHLRTSLPFQDDSLRGPRWQASLQPVDKARHNSLPSHPIDQLLALKGLISGRTCLPSALLLRPRSLTSLHRRQDSGFAGKASHH